ncbi:unnamed protein product [Dracunculus medinensis]|uniref:Copper transport protein n=1 Tax=Dracunculus medinensis TaxID=318479 RepID=A0A0N4U5N2_DRAME|nr:unnamed protein product [Dracunculus medinensis]
MWMWFHLTVDDIVLFDFWIVDNNQIESAQFIFYYFSYKRRLFSCSHLVQICLFALQTIIAYFLMLIFMTFSVWLGLAVIFGASFGYYFFSS